MCANLGGDTDTIGAMATAVCGGAGGMEKIPAAYVELICSANRVDMEPYAEALLKKRGCIKDV